MPARSKHIVGRLPQRSFDHLLSLGKPRKNVPRRVQPKQTYVAPKDRIPLWNISAGDRVRVIAGAMKGKIGTVDWVDRQTNRVHLAEPDFSRPRAVPTERKNAIFNNPNIRANQTVLAQIPIHYSNVALLLERQAQDNKGKGPELDDAPDIVAKRLRATKVRYDYTIRGWRWKRLAESVAEIDPQTGHLTSLELAKEDRFTNFVNKSKPPARAPSSRDVSTSQAAQQTFFPQIDAVKGSYEDLIKALPELAIHDREFFNTHGRAARTKRFNERKQLEQEQTQPTL